MNSERRFHFISRTCVGTQNFEGHPSERYGSGFHKWPATCIARIWCACTSVYEMARIIVHFLEDHDNSLLLMGKCVETLNVDNERSTHGGNTTANVFQEGAIRLEDKRRAVEYWINANGQKRLQLSAVRRKFFFVSSKRQLYRWKKAMEEGRQNSAKREIYDRSYIKSVNMRERMRVCKTGRLKLPVALQSIIFTHHVVG